MTDHVTLESIREYQQVKLYGKDATEWLARWDEGRLVWSIVMGGLGPGYEQAIQMAAAEFLRFILEKNYDAEKWADPKHWEVDREEIYSAWFKNEKLTALQLSGAQAGAAVWLAARLYKHGPIAMCTMEGVKDRLIQVSRSFPSY